MSLTGGKFPEYTPCFLIIFHHFLIGHIRCKGLVHGKTIVQFFHQLLHLNFTARQLCLGKNNQCAIIIQYQNIGLQHSLDRIQDHIPQKISGYGKRFVR